MEKMLTMDKKEKADLVRDLLTGTRYLCKECGNYHPVGLMIYINGSDIEEICPIKTPISFNGTQIFYENKY